MKHGKRIAAAVLIVAQLFLLCGCNALDRMRKNQVFLDGDTLVRDGQTYLLLPECEELCPEEDFGETVFVTASDVPVLLSPFYAQSILTPSTDGTFLVSAFDYTVYCREDMYQQILQRIQNGFTPELVCYSYETYNPKTGEFSEDIYTLTDEQVEVIELITSTVEPEAMNADWSLNYDWSVVLETCSKDMLFRRCDLEIARVGRTYYLLLYTDTETLTFTVPTGCNAQLDQITEAYKASWESFWDEEPEGYI
jgi:hypothetical protein